MTKAKNEKKIEIAHPIFSNLISSFEAIMDSNRKILNYGWVNFPLAYTQVVTMSVNLYFLALLFGRQYLHPNLEKEEEKELWASPRDVYRISNSSYTYYFKPPYNQHSPDFFIPFFTIVEFLCYRHCCHSGFFIFLCFLRDWPNIATLFLRLGSWGYFGWPGGGGIQKLVKCKDFADKSS